nr:LytTR family DNA-binding domain-containing protein [Pontixanthobacter sp. CEM42]
MGANSIARRAVVLIALLVAHGLFAFYNAGPVIRSLSMPASVGFWVVEISFIFGAAAWFRTRVDWTTHDIVKYCLVTLKVGLFTAVFLMIPLTYVDYVFGVNDMAFLLDAPWEGMLTVVLRELAEEVLFLAVPCIVATTILNWIFPVGFCGDEEGNIAEEESAEKPEPVASMKTPEFWEKLKQHRHAKLIALEAQQHYVLVHTNLGSELIHYRFGAAVDELSDRDGVLVHRSYWVARSSIKDIICNGRNTIAVLGSGLEVPISRSRKEEVLAQLRRSDDQASAAA